MAESNSEDLPLLGGNSDAPPSPGGGGGECSPSPRRGSAVVPNWSTSASSGSFRRPNDDDDDEEPDGGDGDANPCPPLSGAVALPPKQVHSQASMDSGCDCDPSDTEGPLHHRGEVSAEPSVTTPFLPPSAGPSGVAPLAQRESLDCHCGGAADQKCCCCYCDSTAADEGGSSTPTTLTHTDRGELPAKVTFRIEGYDDDEETYHRLGFCSSATSLFESSSPTSSPPSGFESTEDFRILVKGATMTFPKVTSIAKSGMLSASSSTASMPMCRICHFPQGEDPDTLISPCRCSGTMQFIHESCLMKWLDVSKSKKAAACELCNYQYNRHKKFKLRHWELPSCSRLDKVLHSIFLLCLIIMTTCATITIYCFKQKLNKVGSLTWLREDRFTKKREGTDLTKSEIVTLTCGVLFFVAFFMAMYVEVKAKDTLYRLFSRFLRLNQTWHIDEYDKQKDNQHAPV